MASVVVVMPMLMVMMKLFASVSVAMMCLFLFMAVAVMCFLVLMAMAMRRFLVLVTVAVMCFFLMAMRHFLFLMTVAVMLFLFLMTVAVMLFLFLTSVAVMCFFLRSCRADLRRAIEVGHIMVMILMGCIQNDIEITARNAGFLDAGDLHHETVCGDGIQRAFQRLRVCAEVDHRCDEHISADAGGSFKV